jgi:hypothetical protein
MRFRTSFFAVLTCWAASLSAAPPLTNIRDTIFMADGNRFTGTVYIEWRSFDASDTSFIGKNSLKTDIIDGVLNIRLVPTTNAASTAWYQVRYVSNGNQQFTEAWAVKPSATPLRIADVRIGDPLQGPIQAPVSGIEIGDINGLEDELALRPLQGPGYVPNRVAVINLDGRIDAVVGAPDDCVRVDGTTGPCGAGGAAVTGSFVDNETPNGVVDGNNTAFSVSQPPSPSSSLLLHRNGILQKQFLDYTVAGSSIEFLEAATPQPGDVLLASYRTAGAGTTIPQVLCTSCGSLTRQTNLISLGACAIAADVLKPGDRVEIEFDYSHEGGTTTGFVYEVRWGSTVLATRTATGSVTLATGRSSVGLYLGAGQWASQTWGSSVQLEVSAGIASDAVVGGLTIDFRGAMSATSTETINLRNFTVTRRAAP